MFRIVLIDITVVYVAQYWYIVQTQKAPHLRLGQLLDQPLQNFEPHLRMIPLGWRHRPFIAKGGAC